jgi:hypothetical protein
MGRGCRYIRWVADRRMTGSGRIAWGLFGAAAALVLAAPDAAAGPCSHTTAVAFRACLADAQDNFLVAQGTCFNLSDATARASCLADAKSSHHDDRTLCAQQRSARHDLCQALGEDAYDPAFSQDSANPITFVDPLKIGNGVTPNPYFPLVQGNQWVYKITTPGQPDQTDTMIVTGDTKLIEGVTCVVVTDQVADAQTKVVLEDTQDWYAQDNDGNVWYCGESTATYQTFHGDNPQNPELQDIEGSWKAGREGAKPGILIEFAPKVGDIYRQEFLLGTAEDVAEVTSTTDSTGSAPEAKVDCTAGNCLVSHESSPLEPGTAEDKYYLPDVGQILGVEVAQDDTPTTTTTVLTSYNVK